MLRAPFSFDGRIRRLEYGLTIIIILVISPFFAFFAYALGSNGAIFIFLVLIPICWFGWAQGAKRCHDLGNNGWYQFIPAYGLWMLFQDGDRGDNAYGENPKGLRNENIYDEMINGIGKSLKP